jgi:hypothetical protein
MLGRIAGLRDLDKKPLCPCVKAEVVVTLSIGSILECRAVGDGSGRGFRHGVAMLG